MNLHPPATDPTPPALQLEGFDTECLLRVRRGRWCWQGSNRASAALGVAGDAAGGAADGTAGGPAGAAAPPPRAFRTASLTKTFTAALVLRLHEDGALALDDRLDRFLPDTLCDRLHLGLGTPQGRLITVRQLLNHRSGLRDYATDAGFMAEVAAHPQRRWSPRALLAAAVRAGPALFAPGQDVAYSDTGYVLLGLVVEAITGAPLTQALRQQLLEPLGLRHSFVEGHEPNPGVAVTHAFAGSVDSSGFDPSFDNFGGGGLVSTAADLDCFITALWAGQVFKQPRTLQAMCEGSDAPAGVGTRKLRTACGMSLFEVSGQALWGHLGHWNSFMLYAPEADLALCGTFNQSSADPRQLAVLQAAVDWALHGAH